MIAELRVPFALFERAGSTELGKLRCWQGVPRAKREYGAGLVALSLDHLTVGWISLVSRAPDARSAGTLGYAPLAWPGYTETKRCLSSLSERTRAACGWSG